MTRRPAFRPPAAAAAPWRIVLAAAMVQAATGGQSYLTGLIIAALPSVIAPTSTASMLFAAVAVPLLSYGLASLIFASIASRVSLRYLAAGAMALAGLGYIALAQAAAILEVGAIFAVCFGVSQIGVPASQSLIVSRISQRRGLAFAIAACGFAIPGLFIAPVMAIVISRYGLAVAMRGYGVLLLATAPAIVRLTAPGRGPSAAAAATDAEVALPIGHLVRRLDFVLVALTTALLSLIVLQTVTYLPSMAKRDGWSITEASFLLSIFAGAALTGKVAAGLITDRLGPGALAATTSALFILGGTILLSASGVRPAFMAGCGLIGLCAGAANVLIPTLIGEVFSPAAFPRVIGMTVPVTVALTFVSTVATGRAVDLTGRFDLSLAVFVGLSVAAGAAALMALNLHRRLPP